MDCDRTYLHLVKKLGPRVFSQRNEVFMHEAEYCARDRITKPESEPALAKSHSQMQSHHVIRAPPRCADNLGPALDVNSDSSGFAQFCAYRDCNCSIAREGIARWL